MTKRRWNDWFTGRPSHPGARLHVDTTETLAQRAGNPPGSLEIDHDLGLAVAVLSGMFAYDASCDLASTTMDSIDDYGNLTVGALRKKARFTTKVEADDAADAYLFYSCCTGLLLRDCLSERESEVWIEARSRVEALGATFGTDTTESAAEWIRQVLPKDVVGKPEMAAEDAPIAIAAIALRGLEIAGNSGGPLDLPRYTDLHLDSAKDLIDLRGRQAKENLEDDHRFDAWMLEVDAPVAWEPVFKQFLAAPRMA